jgi:membrane-associated PAP2 superfamily phosphatase
MASLRIWIILSWIALPTVMFGGYSLLRLLNRGDALTPFQVDCFRAGHAHAGVLLLMSLLYYIFLDRTTLPTSVKQAACVALFVGILAGSGANKISTTIYSSFDSSFSTISCIVREFLHQNRPQ